MTAEGEELGVFRLDAIQWYFFDYTKNPQGERRFHSRKQHYHMFHTRRHIDGTKRRLADRAIVPDMSVVDDSIRLRWTTEVLKVLKKLDLAEKEMDEAQVWWEKRNRRSWQ